MCRGDTRGRGAGEALERERGHADKRECVRARERRGESGEWRVEVRVESGPTDEGRVGGVEERDRGEPLTRESLRESWT